MSVVAERSMVISADQSLDRGTAQLGLSLSAAQQAALLRYLELLQKWTRVYNLTAIRDPQRMLSHHVLDSLAIVPYLREGRVLDVGSGAGLPGIPVAIARPDLAVTLLDSSQKKAAFMQQAIAELNLKNAQVACARLQNWPAPQAFDLITSRAFADLSEFVRQSEHLLAPGGVFLAMKGQRPEDEISRLPAAFSVKAIHRLSVPGVDAERHLVEVERA
jgi:16S rRNA (guanine527-N7)-methyltransferase